MKYLFYLIFAMEIGAAFTVTDWIAEKIKHKYKHQKFYNYIGVLVAILFFVISFNVSKDGWLSQDIVTIILGFIFLCISFMGLTFIQKDYTSHKR
ncbi:MAG: hypothetical protein PHW32_01585 [Bacilli bacterium]|nr:hypothetical protein [Bacilli bacterium]MDD4718852.1 hypothetical protein [Bacilli bacterium]